MKLKLILMLASLVCLDLPATARLITISPIELDFGSVAVGDTGWREVSFQYSGPDSGRVNVGGMLNRHPFIAIQPGSHEIRTALNLMSTAIRNYWSEHDGDPTFSDLVDLGYLNLPERASIEWTFQFSRHYDFLFEVSAVSTDEMPCGQGFVTSMSLYLNGPPEILGWGSEHYAWAMHHADVFTVQIMLVPTQRGEFIDSIDVGVWFPNGADHESAFVRYRGSSGLSVEVEPAMPPKVVELVTAFPNPFNSTTNIAVALPSPSEVRLSIIGLDGKEVAVLKEGYSVGGDFSITWNANDNPAGTYYVSLVSGNRQTLRQILLIR